MCTVLYSTLLYSTHFLLLLLLLLLLLRADGVLPPSCALRFGLEGVCAHSLWGLTVFSLGLEVVGWIGGVFPGGRGERFGEMRFGELKMGVYVY